VSLSTGPDSGADSDLPLLHRAREGDATSLGQLMESCRAYLLFVGRRLINENVKIKVSPSDLVQETFVEGHRAWPQFEGETCEEFRAWLRAILVYRAANVRRRFLDTQAHDVQREVRPSDHSSMLQPPDNLLDDLTPSEHLMREERKQAVQAALGRLPADYQRIIRLRNFDLLEFNEIGALMDRTEGAARALWLRAMQRLKSELYGHDV
jgi:RNA polymerase sigma-70 factor, ECF subfamily